MFISYQHTELPFAIQEAIEFVSLVVPAGGYRYAASHIGPTSRWRDDVHQGFYSIVQQCFNLSETGHNTYFALSAFEQGWHAVPTTDGGTKNMFRTANNACLQKALWLDVDCGKADSPYPDTASAIYALQSFLAATKLPLPTIVFSGLGLHLYWPFVEAIPTVQWEPLAHWLRNLTNHHNLLADHSRTTDAASVLRIPGTINYGKNFDRCDPVTWQHKAGPYHVIDIAGTLLQAMTDADIPLAMQTKTSIPVAQPQVPRMDAPPGLSFGEMEGAFQGPPKHPFRIIKECAQIQRAGIGTYTQWYNMMLVMKHCAFGEQAVHDISKTDPVRYSYENVQEKYQQAVEGGYGPCRCDTFDTKDPGICQSCPYWGTITTPLSLGEAYQEKKIVSMPKAALDLSHNVAVVPVADAPVMDVLPFTTKEFSVVPGQGIVWHKRELVSGELVDPEEETRQFIVKDVLISDTEIYIHSICLDTTQRDVRRSYVIRKQPQGRAAEDILFDIETALGPHSIIKWLAQNSMLPIKPKYNKQMSDFMSTYLAAVQNRLPEILVRETFGWAKNHDRITGESYKGFVVGDTMYSARGAAAVKLTDRAANMSRKFTQRGDLETWKQVPEMYRILNQPFPMLMMCGGLGAPLMEYNAGTATNLAFNLWEIRGGKGKTNVLKAINSMWGVPKQLLMTRSDTVAARYQHYAVYKNLPVTTDEITEMKEWEVSSLLYDVVNGMEKNRSNSSGTNVAKAGTWNTLSFFTANKSLYEMMRTHNAQSQATSMRVIEWQCDFLDYTGTEAAPYIRETLEIMDEHYGHAGPAFMEFLLKRPELIRWATEWAADWANKYIVHNDERFWMYGIGTCLAAGHLAVAAGLLNYNMDWLDAWTRDTLLPTLRAQMASTRPTGVNLLADYLNEHQANTLIVTAAKRHSGQPDPGHDTGMDTYVKRMPTRELFIRMEADTKCVYIGSRHFARWHSANNLVLEATLQELQELKGYSPMYGKVQISLGKDVSVLHRARTVCYKIDLGALNKVLHIGELE